MGSNRHLTLLTARNKPILAYCQFLPLKHVITISMLKPHCVLDDHSSMPNTGRHFLLIRISQAFSGAQSASHQMGTGGSFRAGKTGEA
jgi:hypothetical protein